MLKEVAMTEVGMTARARELLGEAYGRRGLVVPRLETQSPAEIPTPYRELLVHDADMTSTLKRFHRDTLKLDRLNVVEGDGFIEREVLLRRATDQEPVEYGVIRIMLSPFSPAAQEAIVEGRRPLGQILDDFEIPYQSSPSEFFRVGKCELLDGLFEDNEGTVRFGRVNSLSLPSGDQLAVVLEILPRVKFDSAD